MTTRIDIRRLIEMSDDGQGILPSYCHCGGFLDWKDSNTLKCRECHDEHDADELLIEMAEWKNKQLHKKHLQS